MTRLRIVERPWDIDRRRYAVEILVWSLPEMDHWSIEHFFPTALDAQLFMTRFARGSRVISERVQP